MTTRRIRITLIDEMLGTNPGNREVHERFINSKAPDAETREQELEHLPPEEMIKNEMTVFYRDDEGKPAMACYHMYGFFKSACGFLRKVNGSESSKLKAYKKAIDGLIKVYPGEDPADRYLTLNMPAGKAIGDCQRPLRAQTMQGERVAIADSEEIQAGAFVEFDVVMLAHEKKPIGPQLIEEWLEFGVFNGLGQWRNAGHGAFTYEVLA